MSAFCSGLCNEISRCCYDFAHAPFTKKNLLIAGGVLVGLIILIIIIVVASSGGSKSGSTAEDLIKNYPLTDGANSLSYNLKDLFINQLESLKKGISCNSCQTDLDRLSMGHVAVQVFSLTSSDCSAQFKDAVSQTLEQIDVMKRLIASSGTHKMALVLKSSDIANYFKNKKLGVILSVWGGHNIDGRLAVLRMYYDLGVRIMSLVSADPETQSICYPSWVSEKDHNLTNFGIEVIHEMNRLGMIIDLTGCPKSLMNSVLENSKAEVIFSHSGSIDVHNNNLNVESDVLKKYKDKIGLVMVPFTPSQLCPNESTVNDVATHLDKLNEFLNDPSKLGIGSNFDNMTKTTKSLEDVSKFVNLISNLRDRESKKDKIQWTDDKLKGLISSNFLKAFTAIEKKSNATVLADENIIPKEDYTSNTCYSDFLIRYKKTPPTEAPTKPSTTPTTKPTEPSTTTKKT